MDKSKLWQLKPGDPGYTRVHALARVALVFEERARARARTGRGLLQSARRDACTGSFFWI